MEVRDDDTRLAQPLLFTGWDQVALSVVVVRALGQQDPQAVSDRDAGRDQQEGIGEASVLLVGGLVERLPGDQHRHDDGLARPGRHLHGNAEQAGIGVISRLAQEVA